jgi:hypothetical protein
MDLYYLARRASSSPLPLADDGDTAPNTFIVVVGVGVVLRDKVKYEFEITPFFTSSNLQPTKLLYDIIFHQSNTNRVPSPIRRRRRSRSVSARRTSRAILSAQKPHQGNMKPTLETTRDETIESTKKETNVHQSDEELQPEKKTQKII